MCFFATTVALFALSHSYPIFLHVHALDARKSRNRVIWEQLVLVWTVGRGFVEWYPRLLRGKKINELLLLLPRGYRGCANNLMGRPESPLFRLSKSESHFQQFGQIRGNLFIDGVTENGEEIVFRGPRVRQFGGVQLTKNADWSREADFYFLVSLVCKN